MLAEGLWRERGGDVCNWYHAMFVSESAVDIAALQSTGSNPDLRGQGARPVRILPVSQLAPSPAAGGSGKLFGKPGQQKTWMEALLPSLAWMKAYKWGDSLKADAVAGITVGTMFIPQVLVREESR